MNAFDRLKRLIGLSTSDNGGEAQGGMISCEEAAARLFEYLDGELGDVSEEEVRRHLDVCKACYPRAQFERHFLEALSRSQHDGCASDDLKARILQTIARGASEVG